MNKENKNPKAERKMRPEISGEQEPTRTARERMTLISPNRRMLRKIKSKKSELKDNCKRGYDPGMNK
jgi:hypothetical protein